ILLSLSAGEPRSTGRVLGASVPQKTLCKAISTHFLKPLEGQGRPESALSGRSPNPSVFAQMRALTSQRSPHSACPNPRPLRMRQFCRLAELCIAYGRAPASFFTSGSEMKELIWRSPRWFAFRAILLALLSGGLSPEAFSQGFSYIFPGITTNNDITIGNINPQQATVTINFYDSSGKLNSLSADLAPGTQTRVNPNTVALTTFSGSV